MYSQVLLALATTTLGLINVARFAKRCHSSIWYRKRRSDTSTREGASNCHQDHCLLPLNSVLFLYRQHSSVSASQKCKQLSCRVTWHVQRTRWKSYTLSNIWSSFVDCRVQSLQSTQGQPSATVLWWERLRKLLKSHLVINWRSFWAFHCLTSYLIASDKT